jgi:SAM-dependent methyltransferase
MNSGSAVSRSTDGAALALAAPTPAYSRFIERKRVEFAHLARRYELQCLVASAGRIHGIRRQVARLALSEVEGPVLELCCGTGGVTAELAKLFEDVRGVDLSPDMLARAAKRVQREGVINVRLHQAEVSTLRYPAASFSAVVISLGLHELPLEIRNHVLEQIAVWLKPGGRFVLCDYARPQNRLVAAIFRLGGRIWIEEEHFDEYIDYPMDLHLRRHGFTPVEGHRKFLSCLEVSAWTIRPGAGRASRSSIPERKSPADSPPPSDLTALILRGMGRAESWTFASRGLSR